MPRKQKNSMISRRQNMLRYLILGLVGGWVCCAPVFAGERGDEALAAEIHRLSDSLARMQDILTSQQESAEEQLRLQKLNAAIGYLNFRSRRIETLERDLQSTRNVKIRIEDLLEQLAQQEEQLDADSQSSLNAKDGDRRQARLSLERQRSMLKKRMATVDGEIVEMETRLYDLQKQIEGLESFVEKNLKL